MELAWGSYSGEVKRILSLPLPTVGASRSPTNQGMALYGLPELFVLNSSQVPLLPIDVQAFDVRGVQMDLETSANRIGKFACGLCRDRLAGECIAQSIYVYSCLSCHEIYGPTALSTVFVEGRHRAKVRSFPVMCSKHTLTTSEKSMHFHMK